MSDIKNNLFLSLGSNIGDREKYLKDAILLLEDNFGGRAKKSTVHETPPWGNTNQASFLNMIIAFGCQLKPIIALDTVLQIENILGRVRDEKWGPRCIDIDIIFYGNIVFKSDLLTIPHPLMHTRSFVLKPLQEIAPQFIHPVYNRTVEQLIELLNENH